MNALIEKFSGWLRQGSAAALIGAVTVMMIASSDPTHGHEPPLREIHTVIAVTKCGRSFSPKEAIIVSDRTPDIQIKPFLNTKIIWSNGDRITALSHFCMRSDDIPGPINQTSVYAPDFPISLVTKGVFDKPFNFCRWKIARITNFNMRNCYVAISVHMNASWSNAHIGALKNPSVSYLTVRDEGQNDGENANDESRNGGDLIVVGFDISKSEPAPITPNYIEHGKALFVIAGIFLMIILLA
jgi:hypothetical protein